jgi:two-component system NtrC family sensor kinase
MDLFLQERVVNIFNLFHRTYFTLSPAQADMQRYLQSLREASDAFDGGRDPDGSRLGRFGGGMYEERRSFLLAEAL